MQTLSWGLNFFVILAPVVLSVVLVVGTGVLHFRVRSYATAAFFFGTVVVVLSPWLLTLFQASAHFRQLLYYQTLLTLPAMLFQSLGLVFYALSVRKNAHES